MDIPEERKREIEKRAKADAIDFLTRVFAKNLEHEFSREISKADVVLETLKAFWPIWNKAYEDLAILSKEERQLYQGTFLLEGGYMKE